MAFTGEKLMQGIDSYVSKAISRLSYNTTELCTVSKVNDDGSYQVTNGTVSFKAWGGNEKYAQNDSVYVLVPNGTHDAECMILRKKTTDQDIKVQRESPKDNIAIIGDNLIGLNNNIEEKGLRRDDFTRHRLDRLYIKFKSWAETGRNAASPSSVLSQGSYTIQFKIEIEGGQTIVFDIPSEDLEGNLFATEDAATNQEECWGINYDRILQAMLFENPDLYQDVATGEIKRRSSTGGTEGAIPAINLIPTGFSTDVVYGSGVDVYGNAVSNINSGSTAITINVELEEIYFGIDPNSFEGTQIDIWWTDEDGEIRWEKDDQVYIADKESYGAIDWTEDANGNLAKWYAQACIYYKDPETGAVTRIGNEQEILDFQKEVQLKWYINDSTMYKVIDDPTSEAGWLLLENEIGESGTLLDFAFTPRKNLVYYLRTLQLRAAVYIDKVAQDGYSNVLSVNNDDYDLRDIIGQSDRFNIQADDNYNGKFFVYQLNGDLQEDFANNERYLSIHYNAENILQWALENMEIDQTSFFIWTFQGNEKFINLGQSIAPIHKYISFTLKRINNTNIFKEDFEITILKNSQKISQIDNKIIELNKELNTILLQIDQITVTNEDNLNQEEIIQFETLWEEQHEENSNYQKVLINLKQEYSNIKDPIDHTGEPSIIFNPNPDFGSAPYRLEWMKTILKDSFNKEVQYFINEARKFQLYYIYNSELEDIELEDAESDIIIKDNGRKFYNEENFSLEEILSNIRFSYVLINNHYGFTYDTVGIKIYQELNFIEEINFSIYSGTYSTNKTGTNFFIMPKNNQRPVLQIKNALSSNGLDIQAFLYDKNNINITDKLENIEWSWYSPAFRDQDILSLSQSENEFYKNNQFSNPYYENQSDEKNYQATLCSIVNPSNLANSNQDLIFQKIRTELYSQEVSLEANTTYYFKFSTNNIDGIEVYFGDEPLSKNGNNEFKIEPSAESRSNNFKIKLSDFESPDDSLYIISTTKNDSTPKSDNLDPEKTLYIIENIDETSDISDIMNDNSYNMNKKRIYLESKNGTSLSKKSNEIEIYHKLGDNINCYYIQDFYRANIDFDKNFYLQLKQIPMEFNGTYEPNNYIPGLGTFITTNTCTYDSVKIDWSFEIIDNNQIKWTIKELQFDNFKIQDYSGQIKLFIPDNVYLKNISWGNNLMQDSLAIKMTDNTDRSVGKMDLRSGDITYLLPSKYGRSLFTKNITGDCGDTGVSRSKNNPFSDKIIYCIDDSEIFCKKIKISNLILSTKENVIIRENEICVKANNYNDPNKNYHILQAKAKYHDEILINYLPIGITNLSDVMFSQVYLNKNLFYFYNTASNIILPNSNRDSEVILLNSNLKNIQLIPNQNDLPKIDLGGGIEGNNFSLNYDQDTKIYSLTPPETFIQNNNVCLKFYDQEQQSWWYQPIAMFKNTIFSTLVSRWQGDLKIAEEENTIYSPWFVSGKNDANGYTGITIGSAQGDFSQEISKPGIYGFKNNNKVFGLDVDGNAFLKGQIQAESGAIGGLLLSEDKLIGQTGTSGLNTSDKNLDDFFLVAGSINNKLATITKNLDSEIISIKPEINNWNSKIESPPSFYVTHDGTLYTNKAIFGNAELTQNGLINISKEKKASVSQINGGAFQWITNLASSILNIFSPTDENFNKSGFNLIRQDYGSDYYKWKNENSQKYLNSMLSSMIIQPIYYSYNDLMDEYEVIEFDEFEEFSSSSGISISTDMDYYSEFFKNILYTNHQLLFLDIESWNELDSTADYIIFQFNNADVFLNYLRKNSGFYLFKDYTIDDKGEAVIERDQIGFKCFYNSVITKQGPSYFKKILCDDISINGYTVNDIFFKNIISSYLQSFSAKYIKNICIIDSFGNLDIKEDEVHIPFSNGLKEMAFLVHISSAKRIEDKSNPGYGEFRDKYDFFVCKYKYENDTYTILEE